MKPGPTPTDPLERVMRRVVIQPNGCWAWSGAFSSTGYAVFNDRPGSKVYVARWLVQRKRRPESDLRLLRECGTPTCVNPDHHLPTTQRDRFWSRVEPAAAEACWLWGGATVRGDYGRFDKVLAHRFAYEDLVAPIPAGLTIDHLCCTPRCVNPWHMDPVPQSVNSQRDHARHPRRGRPRSSPRAPALVAPQPESRTTP